MLRILDYRNSDELVTRKTVRLKEAEQVVAPILDAVRTRGDEALREYARRFDGFESSTFAIPRPVCDRALAELSPAFLSAAELAAANIREYAALQLPVEKTIETPDGRRLGQVVRPLDAMGAYIPAGRYPLPSTLLMTAVPAAVASVKRRAVVCPRPSFEILGVCSLLRIEEVYQVGGAHAIAALAFGTESIARVDRIVGPGNIYVAAAKKLIAGETGIDFVAGPTEIVIVASEGDPVCVAADMLAQAEHDVDASAILLTRSAPFARAVASEVERQLATLSTADVARQAIAGNSAIVIVEDPQQIASFVNALAPEHLSLEDRTLIPEIRHAGSIFVGPYSPEAAGDYASGPNHVLPTSGAARLRGGLSAADFVKVISVQELSRPALRALTPAIATLARAEGLEAHARSVEARNA